MPIFQYEAINDTGKTRRGNVDADTPRDARDKLRRQKLRVTTMRRIDAGGNTGRGILRFRLQRKVNIRDLAILTRQFIFRRRSTFSSIKSRTAGSNLSFATSGRRSSPVPGLPMRYPCTPLTFPISTSTW